MTFNVGDEVRLKRSVTRHQIEGVRTFPTARIAAFLSDVEGGVALDRRIGCCRYWNVLDLDRVARRANRRANPVRYERQ